MGNLHAQKQLQYVAFMIKNLLKEHFYFPYSGYTEFSSCEQNYVIL